jgi:ABC-type polar amino acid transport system ATPase subunit
MNDDSFVDVEHVWKAFLDNQVLKDVSLKVGLHDVVCLIGASGSGKSTCSLWKLLGIGRPNTFDGHNLTVEAERQPAATGMNTSTSPVSRT